MIKFIELTDISGDIFLLNVASITSIRNDGKYGTRIITDDETTPWRVKESYDFIKEQLSRI